MKKKPKETKKPSYRCEYCYRSHYFEFSPCQCGNANKNFSEKNFKAALQADVLEKIQEQMERLKRFDSDEEES